MTSDRTAPIEQQRRTDDRGLVTDGGPHTDAPTVTVSRLVTRRGKRASVSVPAFDQSVSLDAIALESLTDQDEATDPIEALRPQIEGPGTDAEPTLSMAEDTIRIVNEYSEAVLTSAADGLRITSPPTGHSVVLPLGTSSTSPSSKTRTRSQLSLRTP
ncbi:hypothetical protein [Haloarcula sp. JP-L23]|uniref:hypothetical protein n=1 Tax=Haloarcula sp. JP-L23 TaxID=2716717 RepID=UPI00140F4876|nr:hypothetical protein G9465_20670 [Haloarcula sp. JP-L23]